MKFICESNHYYETQEGTFHLIHNIILLFTKKKIRPKLTKQIFLLHLNKNLKIMFFFKWILAAYAKTVKVDKNKFYLCPIIVVIFNVWNLYANVATIIGQKLLYFLSVLIHYYLCLIIVGMFIAWNLYANVTIIMGQRYYNLLLLEMNF